MQMRFRLFVQQHRGGGVTINPLVLPAISIHAATRDQALAALTNDLVDYVRAYGRRYHEQLRFRDQQELRSIALELTPRSKIPQPPIPITVGLVVTVEDGSRGRRSTIVAPRISGFHLALSDDDDFDARVREALIQHTRKWKSQAIVDADRVGDETLETITIEIPADEAEDGDKPAAEDVLALCGVRLTDPESLDRLSRADRREPLIDRMAAILASGQRSSVLLVGAPDVGKTTLVHELARRIARGDVPEALRDREVWFVTANALIAGMKYIGEWQDRAQKLVAQVRKGRQILYMADPSEIIDAGRWSQSDNNLSRFLRPYVENGEITLICECAPAGVEAAMRLEPSFVNAMQRIDVEPTGDADTQAIVQAAARRLEIGSRIGIDPESIGAIVDLTRRFLPYRAFPGKAISVLQEVVRDAQASRQQADAPPPIRRDDVITSFTRSTGLPALLLSDEQTLRVPEIRAFFEERLLGQPEAITAMVDLITLLKAGLNDPQKPLGSFFFVGPTGVGKTELANVLAEFLFGSRDRMIRFDMSEYASSDALPRLIGSAWQGDKPGELTRRVRAQPFCVLLFDELEKAHADVFDALLGVLGEGRLSDAAGRAADFRNAIIIMTSNLGASRREMQNIGFGQIAADDSAARLTQHFVKEAEQFFRPEFFNRINRIVPFRPLSQEAIRLITRRELGKLLMREGVVRRNLLVEIDDAVIEKLLAQGFHPLYGARPLQREIERMVILPMARRVVDQNADQSHLLRFSVRDDAIDLSLVPLDADDDSEAALAEQRVDRRLEHDLQAITRELRQLRERIDADEATPLIRQLRQEVSALLRRTHAPTFWDRASDAREIMSRIYHLERVLKRRDTLADRAEFLEERARQMRLHRDRRRLPDLARDVDRLGAEYAYLEMELAGVASGQGHDEALLRVSPLSRDSEPWAAQLLDMYTAWAKRKGYEYHRHDPSGEPGAPTTGALYVKGSYVYEFLRHEAGLHKRSDGNPDDRRRILARVAVTLVALEDVAAESPGALDHAIQALLPSTRDGADDPIGGSAVVRSYQLGGRNRSVRDPRTRARVADPQAVLDHGEIDVFLLAILRNAVK